MTSSNFRTIALALRAHVSDTYALLNAADAVESILPDLDIPKTGNEASVQESYDGGDLATKAMMNGDVIGFLLNGQKVNAIIAFRQANPGISLKAAKDAVENWRVAGFVSSVQDPKRAYSV